MFDSSQSLSLRGAQTEGKAGPAVHSQGAQRTWGSGRPEGPSPLSCKPSASSCNRTPGLILLERGKKIKSDRLPEVSSEWPGFQGILQLSTHTEARVAKTGLVHLQTGPLA